MGEGGDEKITHLHAWKSNLDPKVVHERNEERALSNRMEETRKAFLRETDPELLKATREKCDSLLGEVQLEDRFQGEVLAPEIMKNMLPRDMMSTIHGISSGDLKTEGVRYASILSAFLLLTKERQSDAISPESPM